MTNVLTLDLMKNLGINQITRLYQLGYKLEDHTSILSNYRFHTLQGPLLDPVVNFGKVIVSTGYGNTDISVVLNSGNGSKLPDPSVSGAFNLVWWNFTDYPDPSDDPNKEIVRCTARSTDTLTVTRAQEGTTASVKNLAGKTYKMTLSTTAKMITDISSAISARVLKSGDTMTGTLNLPSNGLVVGTNQLIVSGGNVGIGTSSPYSVLHVNYGVSTSPSLTYHSASEIEFDDTGGGIELVGSALVTSPYPYWLQVRSSSNTALPLSLNPLGGSVGIGTLSPINALDVVSNSNGFVISSTFNIKENTRFKEIGNTNMAVIFDTGATGANSLRGFRISYQSQAFGISRFNSSGSGNPTDDLFISATGNVGIGTPSPTSLLTISTNTSTLQSPNLTTTLLQIAAADGNRPRLLIDAYGTLGDLTFRSSLGTASSPSALTANSIIGQIEWTGFGTTLYSGSNAAIIGYASENWTDSAHGTYLALLTTSNGTGTAGEKMRIDNAGNVGIGTSSPIVPLHVKLNQDNPTFAYVENDNNTSNALACIRLIGQSAKRCDLVYYPPANTILGFTKTNGQGAIIADGGLLIRGGQSGINIAWFDDATGNTGIGTTSPSFVLDVDSTSNNIFQVRGKGTSYGGTVLAQIYSERNVSGSNALLAVGSAYAPNILYVQDSGHVGIGTISPGQLLHISGNSEPFLQVTNTGISGNPYVQFGMNSGNSGALFQVQGNSSYQRFKFVVGTTYAMTIAPSGYVYMGGSSDASYQLQLATDSAAKPSTNTWTISSDERIKKDIRPFMDGMNIILGINPVWYKYNGKGGFKEDNKDHIGIIGQEIKDIAPYTINRYKAKLNKDDKEEIELLNFNSHALTFVLTNAIKELNQTNSLLERRIKDLELKIAYN